MITTNIVVEVNIIKKLAIILTIFALTALTLCSNASCATINNTNIKMVSPDHLNDRVVKNVKNPTTGVNRTPTTLSNTILNPGNTTTTGSIVNYYHRENTSSTKYYIGQSHIPSLAAGASNKQNTVLTTPPIVPSASYYTSTNTEFTNYTKEPNENNNEKFTKMIGIQNNTKDSICIKSHIPTVWC